ncbi:hypothetical protein D9611_002324 [Ephemerocybe angulata]|uniref:BZIP domain-containing protein n=1 Tax=Ephemerocybe angulata TaxID=980116 RepID=A0A8H5C1X2_9AGAR|nr:hypothetical protein D9611_002324 [Tulosesus angulatus]
MAGRDRSVSESAELESDIESHGDGREGSSAPGKPGRKKNPNSQAARRDQNRIAQREFRLRKQQRIRDLEARVEILSGGKDEALGEMRNVCKDLMAENQTLRNMLRNLATFIGEGLGGVLPKLGWDQNDFNTFINKGETDTAWEGFQQRKKQMHHTQAETASVPGTSTLQGQKRPAEDASLSGQSKKTRGDDSERTNGFGSLLSPMASSSAVYPQDSRSLDRPTMFSEMMRGSGNSTIFAQPSPPSSASYGNVPTSMDGYQNSYLNGISMPPLNQPMHQQTYETPTSSSSQARGTPLSTSVSPDDPELDDDPNKSEAYKLIHYHLENYKRNSNYCLPSSLRPTVGQRAVPHESVIDSVLHPELRDKLIYNRQKYELADCLINFRKAVTIHGDDVLAHGNWEISEHFFRKYPFLADVATFNVCNRWRKERGEPPLQIDEFAPPTPA